MRKDERIDLNCDVSEIRSHKEYRDLWKEMGRIEVRCLEKYEECRHAAGDVFVYEKPYKRPREACEALLHVFDLYTWRVAFGFPSWNSENRKIFRLHCPDPKGTVWEMKKIE